MKVDIQSKRLVTITPETNLEAEALRDMCSDRSLKVLFIYKTIDRNDVVPGVEFNLEQR